MKIKFEKLIRHPENDMLLPQHSIRELAKLEKRIAEDFEDIPFVVLNDGEKYIILDGNTRHKILEKNKFSGEITCIVKGCVDDWTIEQQRTYIESTQEGRRNASKEWLAEVAKRQAARGLSQKEISENIGMSQQWVSDKTSEEKSARKEAQQVGAAKLMAAGTTQAEAADVVGVDRTTVARDVHFTKNGKMHIPEETLQAVKDEVKQSLSEAEILKRAAEIRKDKRQKINEHSQKRISSPPIPTGKYRAIAIDPPWPIQKIARDCRPNQDVLDYPVMSIEEIQALPISEIAEDSGCHLYLWTTHKFLPDALNIMSAWGFRYQCVLTWIKTSGFTPFSFRYSTELVLFGRKGNLDVMKKGVNLHFTGKSREHSRKPVEFFDIVRACSPEPRIDFFSREKIDGFDQYGNESTKF